MSPAERRYGLTIPLHGHTLAEHGDIVTEAEQLGYTDLWSFETSGIDGFSPLVHAASHTTTVRLGTAIVASYTRGPALLAMSATACEQAAPGRFILGVGASTQTIVESWNGITYTKPVSSVRETVRRMRLAFAGERMNLAAGSRGGFRLDMPPGAHVPVYVGALRAGMLRLAGEVADGVIINFLPARAVPQVLDEVRAGASAAGRDPEGIDVVARHMVCTDEMSDETRFAARFLLAAYVTSPPYEAFLRWLGLGPLIDPVLDAWRGGDRNAALAAMGDDLLGDLLVIGGVDACRARLDEYVQAGVRVPVVAPFSGVRDMEQRRAAIRRMVRELAPGG
ncbi:MAG TPA: LLM class F420-dependent oxidoreductase [Candidatus Dormibacteraeota bacterium]|nr:LLM class F420-dependent oxidoreductase [Candidatus Dormibacteraeota bacterium]